MSVDFTCDLSANGKPFPHFWEHTVGSGHALLALRADWQAQLRRCHDELGFRHVRFHGLLCDDVGTFVIEQNKPVYSFFNSDRIFDFLLSTGMRPFVELSFMPNALASGSKTVFHYQGNVTPPRNYQQWALLIRKLVEHWVERYGVDEVREWFFEVWNEPNLTYFWTTKQNDYFKLYETTFKAIKSVDAELRVGGPATAQNAWIGDFLEFSKQKKLPPDFVSTHYYPTDAFGKVDTDTTSQLKDAPHDIMRKEADETHKKANRLPVYYTEWSISSNPRDPFHDEPFAAALATNIIMNVTGLVDGFSYWTFTDIFEENYFPSVPFHGGFGLLNLYGIAKPVYRAFELLHGLGNVFRSVQGEHETVNAWVVSGEGQSTILLTNHAMPGHQIKSELVRVRLHSSAKPSRASVKRIDEQHANARKAWEEMGSPEYLNSKQAETLQTASSLTQESQPIKYQDGTIVVETTLPPHSVAAMTISHAGS